MPKLEKLEISYQLGIKANLGNFESGDIHVARSETWDVEGMSQEDIDALYEARRRELKTELDGLIESEYKEMLGK